MVSILSKPGFRQRAMPMSIKAWHQMIDAGLAPKRAELIRGVIVEKMSKTILHTKLAGILFERLKTIFGDSFWVRKEEPLTFSDSEPEPDVSVVDGRMSDYNNHPTTARLVVEVAVSSVSEDRDMAEIYAEAGVTEFWIINGPERCVEVLRDPAGGRYQTQLRVGEGGVVECATRPEVHIDVTGLFASAGV
jgi:Uma2 family endonuclease